MASVQREYREVHERDEGAGLAIGGSVGEALGGVAAVILAILALAGLEPLMLASIAVIVVGAALIFAGAAAASRYASASSGLEGEESHMGTPISAEFLGGVTGVVLGILAVLGMVPEILIASSIIVFGASLMLGSAASAQLASMTRRTSYTAAGVTETGHVAREAATAASGSQVLVGLAGIILGIVALVGQTGFDLTLNLIALLVIGAGILLTGSVVGGRMMSMLSR